MSVMYSTICGGSLVEVEIVMPILLLEREKNTKDEQRQRDGGDLGDREKQAP